MFSYSRLCVYINMITKAIYSPYLEFTIYIKKITLAYYLF
jgi:hypothetical protein